MRSIPKAVSAAQSRPRSHTCAPGRSERLLARSRGILVCRSGEKDSNLPGSDNLRAPQTQRSAGTILVRSFLIAAGVLLAGTLCAHANLGDSFIDANKRWGLPVVECSLPNGYKAIYGCHGWVITQIWDHTNVAVAVIYYHPWTGGTRLNEFTKNELAALWLNNTREKARAFTGFVHRKAHGN